MVCQMLTVLVQPVRRRRQTQRVWEVQAAREEAGGARQQHPGQVAPIEILMI